MIESRLSPDTAAAPADAPARPVAVAEPASAGPKTDAGVPTGWEVLVERRPPGLFSRLLTKIGRASCRERVLRLV